MHRHDRNRPHRQRARPVAVGQCRRQPARRQRRQRHPRCSPASAPTTAIVDNGDGTVTVTDTRAGVNDGSRRSVNIESVQFPADGTFTLTVLLNTVPVAVDDASPRTEDTPATYTAAEIVSNDTDANLDALAISAVRARSAARWCSTATARSPSPRLPSSAAPRASTMWSATATAGATPVGLAITVAAVNDAAVITGTATGDVTETGGVASASRRSRQHRRRWGRGRLAGGRGRNRRAPAATAATSSARPVRGSTRSTTTTAAVQALGAGATLNDTFTALTADGTRAGGDNRRSMERTTPPSPRTMR